MRSFIQQWVRDELRPIIANKAALLAMIGGVLGYALLYPQPYLNQRLNDVPIAVVDFDQTALSRQFIRLMDAASETAVTHKLTSIQAAQPLIEQEVVAGVVMINQDFARDLVLGKGPTLVIAGNAAYFLEFSNVVKGAVAGLKETAVLLADYAPIAPQVNAMSTHALFDTHGGYLNYVVPAVFILILHQTMALGLSLVSFAQRGQLASAHNRSPLHTIIQRLVSALVIYLPLCFFYFYICFNLYGIAHLASVGALLVLTVPFVVSAALLGSLIGWVARSAEQGVIIVMFSSLPILFSTGVIWPKHLVPETAVMLSQWLPAPWAIESFLQVNQMGARLDQIADKIAVLWALAAFYTVLCWLRLRAL